MRRCGKSGLRRLERSIAVESSFTRPSHPGIPRFSVRLAAGAPMSESGERAGSLREPFADDHAQKLQRLSPADFIVQTSNGRWKPRFGTHLSQTEA